MPPAFRLDGRIGWRIASSQGLAISKGGLSLAEVPGSAQPLASVNGSFGGMALPMQVAAGPSGSLFLLDSKGVILSYDPCAEEFRPLACLDRVPRRPGLANPIAIAVHPAGELLVLDGTALTITAIRIADGYPVRRSGPFAPDGEGLAEVALQVGTDPTTGAPDGTAVAPAGAWTPADIAVFGDGRILVSDRDSNRLRLFSRRGCLVASWSGKTKDQPELAGPTAIAVGHDGRVFVVEKGKPAVAVLSSRGEILERTDDPALLEGDFGTPSIAIDADGTIWISSRLDGPVTRIGRSLSGQCCTPEQVRLTPAECALLAFDSNGKAILGTSRSPCPARSDQRAYLLSGSFTTTALDSGMIETQWDRIRFSLTIPEGTSIEVRTLASDAELDDFEVAAAGASQWVSTRLASDDGGRITTAIRSAPGRFLWLRVNLAGDGSATPTISGLDIFEPRITSARFLPGTYSAEAESADFLARFLGLYDEMRRTILAPIDELPALYDPMATKAAPAGAPGADFLDWLAGWVGIALDRSWSVDRRRRLVRDAPALYRIRGTVEGLKRFIEVYTGIAPRIVEHFRLRRWLALDETRLDGLAKLWGPDIVRRLELGVYSDIGRFALVDGGNPVTDPIGAFAHRCTLYVPVGDGFSDRDLAALEDVVKFAAPAHVEVDIRLARRQFTIGCDCLLGVNTVLGASCSTVRTDESVLGEDIRLAGPPLAFTLESGMRLGTDTMLQ